MATPSHISMLREISAAGDRGRTGVLDVEWDGAHASLFFMFGHPCHLVFESVDGRKLVGDDALTALVAELPTEFRIAPWRRVMVTEDTVYLTAEDLVALLQAGAPAISNGHGTAPVEPVGAGAVSFERAADAVPAQPPVAAATASSARFGMQDFPLLPLGAVLWSDAMTNVVNLEAVVPRLPDCLLVLVGPEHHAAALVAGGVIADAIWISEDIGLLGRDAGAALMTSPEGELTAYRIDDPRMVAALPTLWRGPRLAHDVSVGWPRRDDIVEDVGAAGGTCAILVEGVETGVALFHDGEFVAAYTAAHRRPLTAMAALHDLLDEPDARVTVARDIAAPPAPPAADEPAAPIADAHAAGDAAPDADGQLDDFPFHAGPAGVVDALASTSEDSNGASSAHIAGENRMTWSVRDSATRRSAGMLARKPADLQLTHDEQSNGSSPRPQPGFGSVGRVRAAQLVPLLAVVTLGASALVWHQRINREFEEFDPTLRARPLRSTLAAFVPWLVGLLVTLTGAVVLVTERLSIHFPLDTHLTGAQPLYLLAGLLAVPYLTLALPFSLVAVVMTLERLRCVEEHIGITTDRQVRPVRTAVLLAIPVIGGPVLVGVVQKRLNAIWDAERTSDAAATAVMTDPVPADSGGDDTTSGVGVADTYVVADAPTADATEPNAAITTAAATESSADEDTTADASVPEDADATAEADATAIAAEDQAAVDAEVSAEPTATDDVDDTAPSGEGDMSPEAVIGADPEASENAEDATTFGDADPAAVEEPAPSADGTEEVAEMSEDAAASGSGVEDQPARFTIAALRTETDADPVATDPVEVHAPVEFVAPRLDFDVDGLRAELTQIAVGWVGANDAVPVAEAIAAARPGVDDFVSTIAAIGVMEIPGHESAVVHAMAREMHYRASEVLCGV